MTETLDHRRNVLAGWVSLAIGALAVAIVVAVLVYSGLRPGDKPFVMYVANSGTIGRGDPVLMNGRHIGRVTDAQVLRQDGEVLTRVDFVVFERYRDIRFPTNSKAAISAPGLSSGPSLILAMGDGGDAIEARGEFTQTSSASSSDVFTDLGRQVESADRQIAAIVRFFDDEEMIADIGQALVAFRNDVDAMADGFDAAQPELLAAVEGLNGAPGRIAEIRKALDEGSDGMTDNLRRMSRSLADSDGSFEDFERTTREATDSLHAYEQATSQAAELAKDPAHRDAFLRARWAAAELAAMADRAVSNPNAIGDEPGYWRAAQKFNGGDSPLAPFGGRTKLDESK